MPRVTPTKPELLIVEDDEGLRRQLKWAFADYVVLEASDQTSAIANLRRFEPAVVILDLGLPPDPANVSEGMATLQQILELAPHTKVIVSTGNDEHETAVQAIGMGAYDFLPKPVDATQLQLIVARAFRLFDLEVENRRLRERRVGDAVFENLLGASTEMTAVFRTVEKVAPTNARVLLLGESGTGKELIAQALHKLSQRADGPFVAINCAAIPGELLESELFGYEKGAFTGANKTTPGKVEFADGGTLFLDEIGDLPVGLQAKLLRFLQEQVIERVGGREEIAVDVRVLCATHQNLAALIEAQRFREDLYYRVSEVSVDIPPLRERSGDAVLLAQSFLRRFCEDHEKTINGFSPDAIAAIESHPWRGNVRELENVIKRAVILSDGHQITAQDLGIEANGSAGQPLNLREVRDAAERSAILRALTMHEGNVSLAAKDLGISRPTLYGMMNKFNIAR